MAKASKKRRKKEEGEVFYRAHPIAPSIGRVQEAGKLSVSVQQALWWLLGVVEVILLLRIVIAAFGATGGNLLTSFIYAISYPFVIFFFYLFNTTNAIVVTSPRFELETLAAMAFYYIVIYIVTELISVFSQAE